MRIAAKRTLLVTVSILFAVSLAMAAPAFSQKAYAEDTLREIAVSSSDSTENAKYGNAAYAKAFGVSSDCIASATANGGEYANGDTVYAAANAFDGNDRTYWYSQSENSDTFANALTVTFTKPLTLGAFLYKSAYFSTGGRQFAGYPRTLNVYAANDGDDFAAVGTCVSEPTQGQSEGVIFSFDRGVTCRAIRLEFADVSAISNGFAWLNGKKLAAAGEISFFQSEGAPLNPSEAATESFADPDYLRLNSVSADESKYRSNGGELTVGDRTYALSDAFDKKTDTFWCSESANTREFINKLTIVLDAPETLDSIVLGCAGLP